MAMKSGSCYNHASNFHFGDPNRFSTHAQIYRFHEGNDRYRTNQTVDMEAVLSGLSADAATILSEIEILTSRTLVARVVADLGLRDVAEFNASLRPKDFFATTLNPKNWWPEDWMDWKVLYRAVFETHPARVMNAAEIEEQISAKVVDSVISGFAVTPVSRSYVIKISFRSEEPRRSPMVWPITTFSINWKPNSRPRAAPSRLPPYLIRMAGIFFTERGGGLAMTAPTRY